MPVAKTQKKRVAVYLNKWSGVAVHATRLWWNSQMAGFHTEALYVLASAEASLHAKRLVELQSAIEVQRLCDTERIVVCGAE